MDSLDDIKKSIIIIALDNLIGECNDSLEEADEDQKEYLQFIIDSSKLILQEIGLEVQIPTTIKRPSWKIP